MDAWHEFATLTAGTLGVLIGLLFVGLSFRASTIESSSALRYRVAQVLVLFLGLLCANALVLIPIGIQAMGVVLLALAFGMGWALMHLDHKSKQGGNHDLLEHLLDRINPNVVTYGLLTATGIALIFRQEWGGFLLAGADLFGTVGGLAASWFLVFPPTGSKDSAATPSQDE